MLTDTLFELKFSFRQQGYTHDPFNRLAMQSQGGQGKRHLIDQIVYVASVKAPIHSSKIWTCKIAVGENLASSREDERARPSVIQHFSKTSNSRTKQKRLVIQIQKEF